MEYLVAIIIILWIIGSRAGNSAGNKIHAWGHKYRCDNCGHDKFLDEDFLRGKIYDTITARCAKCDSYFTEDGPCK